jgi:hypothetical protein
VNPYWCFLLGGVVGFALAVICVLVWALCVSVGSVDDEP